MLDSLLTQWIEARSGCSNNRPGALLLLLSCFVNHLLCAVVLVDAGVEIPHDVIAFEGEIENSPSSRWQKVGSRFSIPSGGSLGSGGCTSRVDGD